MISNENEEFIILKKSSTKSKISKLYGDTIVIGDKKNEIINEIISSDFYASTQHTVNYDEEEKENPDDFISSKDWLLKYSLKSLKVDLFEILRFFCFGHCYGVVEYKIDTKKNRKVFIFNDLKYYEGDIIPSHLIVNAVYCKHLFPRIFWNDGSVRHVNLPEKYFLLYTNKLRSLEQKYRDRYNWLSQGSRKIFGTILEQNVCFLIDKSGSMGNMDYLKANLKLLLQEQLRFKKMYNFVSFSDESYAWNQSLVPVNIENTQSAIRWIDQLDSGGNTHYLEGLRRIYQDQNLQSIYLLTDGAPTDNKEDIIALVESHKHIPIHGISYNCSDQVAINFMRDLASRTGGRFNFFDGRDDGKHESEEKDKIDEEIQKCLEYIKQIQKIREQSILLYENTKLLTKRENTLSSFEYISKQYKSSTFEKKTKLNFPRPKSSINISMVDRSSNSISNWLKTNSLQALNLTLFDVLLKGYNLENESVSSEILNSQVFKKINVLADSYPLVNKNHLTMLNMKFIHLDNYLIALQNQIKTYQQYLAEIVHKSLPDREKEILKMKNITIIDSKNRDKVLKSLEFCNWPIKKQDYFAIENEIKLAEKFLAYSKELNQLVSNSN